MSKGNRLTTGNASANFMSDEEGTGAANIRGDTSRRSRHNQPSARSGSSKRQEMRKKIVINVSKNLDESDGEDANEEGKGAIFYKKQESEVPSRVGTAD